MSSGVSSGARPVLFLGLDDDAVERCKALLKPDAVLRATYISDGVLRALMAHPLLVLVGPALARKHLLVVRRLAKRWRSRVIRVRSAKDEAALHRAAQSP